MKVTKEEINKMYRASEYMEMVTGERRRRCSPHTPKKQYKRKDKYKNNFSEAE